MDSLVKIFCSCPVCGRTFENTDGAPETCGASKCQETYEKEREENE